ncbi:tRNA uridine-5-carboxymethylaminomethyl(34) synthesis GTPase MnmE [Piscinibacter sakaiensis]|uniref:tRNA modification GTPase MnmE n=1 Tax=Piscinibacter sakaiensis TaxID=1547922 RepID=A0A0K8P5F2_PISS1|nr:tRNA uridine-5-carboxymethylaminomethyl(34) synthesis GTPase MnmE [Piscinibacter sakaiensis]GAP37842.1 GTPase and tRNA-U34 5-formylation enzyme TrmE [Piscinibacter sakaiensis]
MLGRHHEPIVAVATAAGRGAVGIVRASGRDLGVLVQALCGRPLLPRHATYLPFLGADGQPLDQGLALHFPAPHSATGEEVLELQAHGGPVLLQLLLARCLEAGRPIGLRLAEPGEFTQRAFLNDKLDLAQAEAVADLIDASTEAAARSAGRALAGAFSGEVNALRDELVALRLLVEATLDFPEEEIDFLQQADARGRLERVAATLDAVLARTRQGALLREGMQVVLAGQPNVGKSSLLNALAGAELAIVTPIAGTTRDRVRETIQIDGVPVHVTDTAGLRADGEAADEVERIGIGRSWSAIEAADAVVFLRDLARAGEPAHDAADDRIAERLAAHPAAAGRLLCVWNKADAVPPGTPLPPLPAALQALEPPVLRLSAATGEGLEALRRALLRQVGWDSLPEGLTIARSRHVEALHRTRGHLQQARALAARDDAALDLLAEELRLAQDALGAITGAFSADDLLGEIFGRFCIGK